MEITAKLKHLRMAPRKVRVVANLIKGLNIDQARAQLRALPKRASGPVLKTLNSAVANAEHNFQLSKDNLYIAKIFVDGGPMLKRWMPRAMGRASAIQKKTSHLTVILGERIAAKAVKKAIKAKAVQTKQVPETALEKTAAEKIKSAPRAEKKEAIAKERAGGFAKRMFRRKSV
ncbi:50S ribosomal protein L22 [Candidatus Azambacteria bacterium RIFCSPHIGHO2_01_46_10]|uniref:Large ribosomal subunit protein uL22 n=11 Tax=Parcubacteria group TaxID=1794811 RepID=A0A1F5C6M0_9BACT|nr:MAG: 50S ribosomal protein L22 [Candidatus Azambacteria bacterium GW2011_GWE2_46_45]OGD35456.1 MAG: 50S ribosomal protein L22 [Candidatus Azambacteria bacterium RIFCSPHIGHO2_01_46_10]OGD38495.1 MAG: 50S ribosomal protein L22 [Candidatus Azambacteria bacterium RIFCSPLOWO2_01_FULL_46_26]OGD45140.1 MAG: 50S ribosomal protein L22 [Candidatus Azambacteria bacterium RIFCSPLOWO2_02_FULL_46_11]HAM95821.1 50S ribosomal protein L22 [Candidatus Azambacteria bacterium]